MRYVSIREPTDPEPAVSVAEQTRLDALVVAHLPIVRMLAKQLARRFNGLPFDDILQAGTIGLLHAAPRFKPEAGVLFATFVGWRIRGAMLDEIRRQMPTLDLREGPRRRQVYPLVPLDAVAEPTQPRWEPADPWLQRHIDALPPREARLIRDYYWGGLRFSEIMPTLQVNESRVSQLHARAIFKLRTALTAKVA